jgi:hypothetical protein
LELGRNKKEKRNILYRTLLPPKGKTSRAINNHQENVWDVSSSKTYQSPNTPESDWLVLKC